MRYALAALTFVVIVLQIPFIFYMNPEQADTPAEGRLYPEFMSAPEAPSLANVTGRPQAVYEYDEGMPKLGDGTIRGVALNTEGAPAAGAEVRIERRPLGAEEMLAYHASAPTWAMPADARGVFVFRDLPPGEFLVRAESGASHALAGVTLKENGPAGEVLLKLWPSQGIAGTIAAPDGAPVKDAQVYPMECEGTGADAALYRCAPVFSGEDGGFALRHLPEGRWRLLVTARNQTPTLTRWLDTQPLGAAAEPVRIGLAVGTPLGGLVVDCETDAPVSGVKVEAVEAAYGAERYTGKTGPGGGFRMENLRPAQYRITVVSDLYVLASAPVLAGPVSGDGPDMPRIAVCRGGTLRGRVTDADSGMPVAGATVWLDTEPRRTVQTDAAGYYRFTALAGGTYAAGVTPPPDYLAPKPAEVAVTLGERAPGPAFALQRGGTLSGKVLDESGAPVAFANVFVSTHPSADPAQAVQTDAEGAFSFAGLPRDGELWCWAEKLGWASTATGPVTLGEAVFTRVALKLTEEVGLQARRYE